MKYIALLILLTAIPSYALVNLDEPLSIGPHDMAYKSGADPSAAYLIPVSLVVQGNINTIEIDGEYRSQFQVGYDTDRYNSFLSQVPGLRMIRGVNATLLQDSPIDIPKKFRPKFVALGDPGEFGGSLLYRLSIRKIGPKQGKESQKLLDNVFKGSSARHLGQVAYEFNAILTGQPYLAKTVISIFSSVKPGDVVMEPMQLKMGLDPMLSLFDLQIQSNITPTISLDRDTGCWNQPRVGEICLK